jgi:2-dehydropantoate 2-reductase
VTAAPNLSSPRIAIVGSGAIGSYFGGCLAEAGFDVHFLMRSDLAAVRERGLHVGRLHAPPVELMNAQCHASTSEIGPCDLVLVALKSTDSAVLEYLIPPLLKADTVLLTLQNGLGNVEYLQGLFGKGRVVGGIVFMGITRVAPGRVENYNPNGGTVTLGEPGGSPGERIAALAALMEKAKIIAKTVPDFQLALWRKLVWNVPFNGLTVVTDSSTDRILDNPELAALAHGLMKEVQAGAAALGLKIEDIFLDRQFDYTRSLGAYRPSSLIDYRAGRPLEVEGIWGEPLRRATAAGVQMPCLALLYAQLRALSGKRRGA